MREEAISRQWQRTPSLRAAAARWIFLRLCAQLEIGSLQVVLPDGSEHVFEGSSGRGIETHGKIHVLDDDVFADVLSQGDWGLGWAFVFGRWQSDSPYRVCLVLMLNEHVFRKHIRR